MTAIKNIELAVEWRANQRIVAARNDDDVDVADRFDEFHHVLHHHIKLGAFFEALLAQQFHGFQRRRPVEFR